MAASERGVSTIRVTFVMPSGERREVDARVGETLLMVAQTNNIAELEGACESSMACSTCHVVVDAAFYGLIPPPSEEEDDMLDFAYGLTLTSRLGCQVVMTEKLNGLIVRVPAERNNALLE